MAGPETRLRAVALVAPTANEISILESFLDRHPRLVVLTGAGVSLAAGIPTYRNREGTWIRSKPILHQRYVAEPLVRRRYWARSFLGWPTIAAAKPGSAHLALAELEWLGHVSLLITQNVDRLHQRAGSRNVVDLHGRLDRVVCLSCTRFFPRKWVQDWLGFANPQLHGLNAGPAPDGDADLPDEHLADMRIPDCRNCGGTLMPDVVFFGGTVPPARVAECRAAVAEADALMAIGTSLQVFSGYRFCRQAAELGKPVAVLNPGRTRADDLATVKLATDCEPLLTELVTRHRIVRRGMAGRGRR